MQNGRWSCPWVGSGWNDCWIGAECAWKVQQAHRPHRPRTSLELCALASSEEQKVVSASMYGSAVVWVVRVVSINGRLWRGKQSGRCTNGKERTSDQPVRVGFCVVPNGFDALHALRCVNGTDNNYRRGHTQFAASSSSFMSWRTRCGFWNCHSVSK